LTTNPTETMRILYAFLDEDLFAHDFDNVNQITHEDDRAHGIRGLHEIRNKIAPVPSRWLDVLGEGAMKQGELNFWKHQGGIQ